MVVVSIAVVASACLISIVAAVVLVVDVDVVAAVVMLRFQRARVIEACSL